MSQGVKMDIPKYAGGTWLHDKQKVKMDSDKPDQGPTEAPAAPVQPNPTNARDGLIDDLAAVALAVAEGRPIDTRQAVVAVAGAAGGAMVGTAVLGMLGIKGGVLGAVGAVLGAIALDVALVKWAQRQVSV